MPVAARPALLIFQGGVSASDSWLERLVAEAQNAATLDLVLAAHRARSFSRVVLVTEDRALAEAVISLETNGLVGLDVTIGPGLREADGTFHFGKNLLRACHIYSLERVVYAGGGSMPLATPQVLSDLALAVGGAGECVVSNNLFSADLVAFNPASALERVPLPENDNDLAWLLHYRAGLPHAPTVKSLATHFDVDTPTDLAVLRYAAASAPLDAMLGPHLARLLGELPSHLPKLCEAVERAYAVMATRRAQVLVAGRVSSWTWRRLEANLPCQTRIISEERGMRAAGREARGEVRSLLGMYSDLAGVQGLVAALEATSDAAFIDTRVLFAHHRLSPSRSERFASDAFRGNEVSAVWVRELTEAASHANIPVVLGGHSLVAGGVWALSERVRASGSSAAS